MRDETNVVATDYNESKLGIDAARLTLLTDNAQFDAYWIPFFTPSILPLAKGNPLHSRTFTKDVDGIIDLWDNSTASELELEYNLTDAITAVSHSKEKCLSKANPLRNGQTDHFLFE